MALVLAMPGAASASAQDVLNDCFDDDSLSREYSRSELREARGQMQADFEAYSECDDIIDGLLRPKAGIAGRSGVPDGDAANDSGRDGGLSGGTGGGSGGSGSVSDAGGAGGGSSDGGADSPEEAAQKRLLARADAERELGDRAFDPRSGAAISTDGTTNGLPLPVLLALIALTLLLAAGALMAVHRRNPAFMGALRRVPFLRRRR